MKTKHYLTVLFAAIMTVATQAQTQWHNPMAGDEPYVNGRAWNTEIGKTFHRMPERMKDKVPKAVWNLSKQCGGLSITFETTSENITVKYVVPGYPPYPNMAKLNHSGVDLYASPYDGVSHWIGNHMRWSWNKDTVSFSYGPVSYGRNASRGLIYTLYLPPYNEVKSLEIGVDRGAKFQFLRQDAARPIVIYGSSIIQGASSSRPGNMITNIVGRELDYPVVNLGFSGSAYMEPAMFDALAEIDAKAYVLDPMPNSFSLNADSITHRALDGIRKLRKARPDVPIVMVESGNQPDSVYLNSMHRKYRLADAAYRKAYETLKAEGADKLYYVSHTDIGLTEDAMIEGTHPNDIGCRQYAEAYKKPLREILFGQKASKRFQPVSQRRDGSYTYMKRHNAVIKRNHSANPEILLIGNSITHFMGGEPLSEVNYGGDAFKKLFGKRTVTNMGFGWDRIENVYWRLFHGELEGCKPRHICLLIGINNVNHNGTLPEIAQGIIDLAGFIHELQPQAKLHVLKVLPCRDRFDKVKELNRLLEEKFQPTENVDLLDLTQCLLNKEGTQIAPECFRNDGLHLAREGYLKIGKVLKKQLK